MLGRAVIAQGNPAKVDEVIAFIRERVQPLADAQAGSHGLSMFVNRETGLVLVSSAWEDEAALRSSDAQLEPARRQALALLEAPEPRIEIMQPIIIFQNSRDQVGYWTRASELRFPPDRLDDGIATFRSELLPAIRARLEGVNSIALMLNRQTGHGVVNVTFTSREALDASREVADQLRSEFVRDTGAEAVGVMEMEVAIVGIRPPIDLPAQGAPVEFTLSRTD